MEMRPDIENTQRDARGVRLAQGMAWFSVALGATQLLAPQLIQPAIGVRNRNHTLIRALGARELLSGLGLLTSRNAVRALDARLVGDVIDLALLGIAMFRPRNGRKRLIASTLSVLGATALDALARHHLAADPQRQERVGRVTRIGKSVTIDATPHAVYTVWRTYDRLAVAFPHLQRIAELDDRRSRWSAEGGGGMKWTWEAEITEDKPGELIAWKTTSGAMESRGVVRFLTAPGGRGTEVVVEMEYTVIGRGLGRAAAAVMGIEPGVELERGLRRLKQIFELGEPMLSNAKEGAR